MGLRFTWFIFHFLSSLSPSEWLGILDPKEQTRMDSQKTLVLEKKVSGDFLGASVRKSSVFMAHAIQLPEVKRTRDELTSRLAILISKWQRITILMKETMNLIACFFFTYIQSTSILIAVKERVETLVSHVYTCQNPLSNTWSNIAAINHASFMDNRAVSYFMKRS